jgi:hypothetical protein
MKNYFGHPLLLSAAVAVLLTGAPAFAEDSSSAPLAEKHEGPNSQGITLWGVLGYGDAFGVGGRYMMPVVPEGFLHNTRFKDQLAVDFGADLLWYSYGFLSDSYGYAEVLPVGGVLWTVWFNDKFAVYPKLDVGFALGTVTGWNDAWGPKPTHGGFFWQTSAGLIYKTSSVALRAEVGNGLFKAGVGFGF